METCSRDAWKCLNIYCPFICPDCNPYKCPKCKEDRPKYICAICKQPTYRLLYYTEDARFIVECAKCHTKCLSE